MDIFDHGQNILVIFGQFAPVKDLSISIEKDRSPVRTIGDNTISAVKQSQIEITATVDGYLHIPDGYPMYHSMFRLYNAKHEIKFRHPMVHGFTHMDGATEVELAVQDYDVRDDWYEAYS